MMLGRGYQSGMVMVLKRLLSPQGLQPPSFFLTMWKEEDQVSVEQRIMPAFSMVENSAFATASLLGSRRRCLVKTGGPGCVRRWCRIRWQGGEGVKPSKVRTSGNLERRSETHFGAERRVARREEYDGGNEVRDTEGEELLKTFWLATSSRRL